MQPPLDRIDYYCYRNGMDVQGFALRLKAARMQKGFNMRELSRMIGKSPSYVKLWESGKRGTDAFPAADILDALAVALDVSEDWLKGKTDDPRRPVDAVAHAKTAGIVLQSEGLANTPAFGVSSIDEHTRQMAEIGERVVSMVEQRRNIIPGPQIRPVKGGSFRLPIVNNLSAAQLSSDIREVATWLDVPEYLLKGAVEPLGFIVVGDCLREKWGIRTGDTLIVDAHNKRPRDGEIVAALINDEDRTAKEFWRVQDGVDLRPTTPGYETIKIRGETQLVIIGVYVNHLTTGDRNVY